MGVMPVGVIDLFGNAYNDHMMTYQTLSTQPRAFLVMTGLTTAEFGDLLSAFETAYEEPTLAIAPQQVNAATGGSGADAPAPSPARRTNCCSS